MLLHKGFIGKIDYDERTQRVVGEVVNSPDLLEFDGKTAKELQQNFIKCVNDYETINNESRDQNSASFIGQYSVSLSSQVLDKVMRKAKRDGASVEIWLNRWINESLDQFLKK